MNRIYTCLCLLFLLTAYQAEGQDNYQGSFRGKKPYGTHIQFDENGQAALTVQYSGRGIIESVRIGGDSIQREFRFTQPFDSIEWKLIKKGLWINKEADDEVFVQKFPKKAIVHCHYAGYLLNGQSFDNSFVRTLPLQGKLGRFVPGFSLGIWNIPPGEVRVIKIAPKLAYKNRRIGIIPPHATLIYFIYRID
ncbi:MAG: FKBP-type peptidyl-prolyl cis-trans isomerase [Bacteroidota bacterium]